MITTHLEIRFLELRKALCRAILELVALIFYRLNADMVL